MVGKTAQTSASQPPKGLEGIQSDFLRDLKAPSDALGKLHASLAAVHNADDTSKVEKNEAAEAGAILNRFIKSVDEVIRDDGTYPKQKMVELLALSEGLKSFGEPFSKVGASYSKAFKTKKCAEFLNSSSSYKSAELSQLRKAKIQAELEWVQAQQEVERAKKEKSEKGGKIFNHFGFSGTTGLMLNLTLFLIPNLLFLKSDIERYIEAVNDYKQDKQSARLAQEDFKKAKINLNSLRQDIDAGLIKNGMSARKLLATLAYGTQKVLQSPKEAYKNVNELVNSARTALGYQGAGKFKELALAVKKAHLKELQGKNPSLAASVTAFEEAFNQLNDRQKAEFMLDVQKNGLSAALKNVKEKLTKQDLEAEVVKGIEAFEEACEQLEKKQYEPAFTPEVKGLLNTCIQDTLNGAAMNEDVQKEMKKVRSEQREGFFNKVGLTEKVQEHVADQVVTKQVDLKQNLMQQLGGKGAFETIQPDEAEQNNIPLSSMYNLGKDFEKKEEQLGEEQTTREITDGKNQEVFVDKIDDNDNKVGLQQNPDLAEQTTSKQLLEKILEENKETANALKREAVGNQGEKCTTVESGGSKTPSTAAIAPTQQIQQQSAPSM